MEIDPWQGKHLPLRHETSRGHPVRITVTDFNRQRIKREATRDDLPTDASDAVELMGSLLLVPKELIESLSGSFSHGNHVCSFRFQPMTAGNAKPKALSAPCVRSMAGMVNQAVDVNSPTA